MILLLELVGVLALGWTVSSVARMLHPKAKLPADLTPPSGVRAEDLHTAQGAVLPVWIYEALAPRGILVACHGYYANQRQLQGMAEGLRRRGYTIVTSSWRGHGSRGGRTTFGRQEVPDLLGVLEWVRAQPAWAVLPLGLIGWSFGGAMACQAAVLRCDVRALITDSSYARLFPLVANVIRRDYHLPAIPFAYLTWWGAQLAVGRRLGRRDPVALAAAARQALFLIHGTADASVPLSHAEALYAAWGGPKEQWLLPGVAHVGAFEAQPDVYCGRIARFCDAWLASPSARS